MQLKTFLTRLQFSPTNRTLKRQLAEIKLDFAPKLSTTGELGRRYRITCQRVITLSVLHRAVFKSFTLINLYFIILRPL